LIHDTLVGFGLRKILSQFFDGKIITGFSLGKTALALGADGCNSCKEP